MTVAELGEILKQVPSNFKVVVKRETYTTDKILEIIISYAKSEVILD